MSMDGYGNPLDYTYGNPLVDELAGVPLSAPRMRAAVARTKPRTQSTSIAPTTAIESVQPQAPVDPLQARLSSLESERTGLLKDQDAAYAKPDYTGYADYAKQRQASGSRALVLALAAKEAGMEPFQAQYLKQAAEARAPMKVTGGTITDTGFVEDVGHAQELAAKRVDARLAQIERQMQFTQNAQERARLSAEANDLKRFQIESNLQMKQMMAGIAAGNRQNTTSLQQDRIGGQVYDDYMKASKDDITVSNTYKNLQATAAKAATGGSDLSFIFQYMKMLDPNSVVREGEFANAQNSAGVPDRIRNAYNRAMQGTRLTSNQRQEFLDVAGRLSGEAERRLSERRTFFAQRLRQQQPNPEVYLPGYEQAAPQGAPEGAVREQRAPAAAPVAAAPDSFPAGAVRPKVRQ